MRCGLLGKKLGHSYSPQIHSYLGEYQYELFERPPEKLEEFLQTGDFVGLNVTIPYKKDVLPYCNDLSDCAKMLGAVNTIVRSCDGTLVGHNTDYFGFKSMLVRTGLRVSGKKVLVLGSGGASVTVSSVLKHMGADVIVISRSGKNNYSNLHMHADASVIVNATPVGMFPNTGVSPIDLNLFPDLEGVMDVIYNPARTKLLLDAEERGLITENGLWMLVAQAKESAEWFTGKKIADGKIAEIHEMLRAQMENVVLIGMPGSGKTTIGQILSERLGRRFIDTDVQIEMQAGMSIPDIFSTYGEDGFRKLETKVLSQFGKESGLVIATGGGCVTKKENYSLLHQNGKIIWIERAIHALPTDGRPLSIKNKMKTMYAARKPMYERFSDCIIHNNATVEEIIDKILEKEKEL